MKYTIHEEYYYLGNGCSCCEPDRYESYSVVGEDGKKLGFIREYLDFHEHTFHSQQEALEFLLKLQGIEVEYTYEEEDE